MSYKIDPLQHVSVAGFRPSMSVSDPWLAPLSPVMAPATGKRLLRTGPGLRPHVRRGQLLLSAEPFVYVLKADGLRVRCSFCLDK